MTTIQEKHSDVTILIIDDDPATIVATSKALRGLGQIIFATNGDNGLKLAQEKLPDVILLDAEMPEMNGFEVCEKLKAKHETSHIPVIFVTSRTESSFEAQVFEQGASDYISKPMNPRVAFARASLQINYKRAIERLKYLSHTDGLTGLHNRRSFDKKFALEFKRAMRTNIPISLLMIDIDQFKKYNDHFGHIVGDICIQQVSNILIDSIKRPSDLVARYGGEEFTVILPDTDQEGAKHFAQTLLKNVQRGNIKHAPSAQHDVITVSIGYSSLLPSLEDTAENLLKVTDEALFEAKNNGRANIRTINNKK